MRLQTRPLCPRLPTRPQMHAPMCSNVRSRKRSRPHISAALPVHTIVRLYALCAGEWRERRGEQLTVMPVPRTLSGPVLQLKPDVCPLSASSSFTGLQLSITKCHSLQKTDLHVELWSHLSLLENWQADQFTCITHTPTLRGVIMVKIVHTTIKFLRYTVSKNVHFFIFE